VRAFSVADNASAQATWEAVFPWSHDALPSTPPPLIPRIVVVCSRSHSQLLLLGAGESGKSTIFKQMRILYGKGFSEDDRRAFVPVVQSNVLASIRTLMHHAADWGVHVAARVRVEGAETARHSVGSTTHAAAHPRVRSCLLALALCVPAGGGGAGALAARRPRVRHV
jgi:hypothetical protein